MARMLQKELDGLDAEIIYQKWDTGLKKAKGNFVCLLEKNSAVSPGTIRDNLNAFLAKPAYRKLAMVSPCVDLAIGVDPVTPLGDGVFHSPSSIEPHAVRIGYVPGSVIRASSLRRYQRKLGINPVALSELISTFLWENGLRIELNPDKLYYQPECTKYKKTRFKAKPSLDLLAMWDREMIS